MNAPHDPLTALDKRPPGWPGAERLAGPGNAFSVPGPGEYFFTPFFYLAGPGAGRGPDPAPGRPPRPGMLPGDPTRAFRDSY